MIDIRAAESADARQIAEIYAPFVRDGIISFETEPPGTAAMRKRMTASGGLYPWIVATNSELDGRITGYAYAGRFRDRPAYRYVVETSIYIAPWAQRRGMGRLLYQALVDTLRAQNFTQAIGVIALPNDASIRVHEAVGFRRAGIYREVGYKNGQWIDVGYWQAELNRPQIPPAEPRPFSEVGLVRL